MAIRKKPKQIFKLLAAMVGISNFPATASSSDVVTTALTSALSTAGDNGTAVPLQVYSSVVPDQGVIATGNLNKINVWDTASKERVADGTGKEVYARITAAAGVYTISYFSIDGLGAEQAYTFPSVKNIDIEIPYVFDFVNLPTTAIISLETLNIADDPSQVSSGTKLIVQLTATALNTIPNLPSLPNAIPVKMYVNGQMIDSLAGSGFAVNLANGVITITPSTLGWNIETTDRLIFEYYTFA